jgi:outer membrane protein TolC
VNETLQNAEEAVRLTAGLYREGRKSIADLLEMRQVYLEFGLRRLEILYRLEYEDTRLLFLTGQLDETQIKEIAKRVGDTEE